MLEQKKICDPKKLIIRAAVPLFRRAHSGREKARLTSFMHGDPQA
jgi:hypothetical protein